MASTRLPLHPVLVLVLVLVSLASASHHFGGTVTFSYKGRNPDGTYRVDFRNRDTFDGCQYSHYWQCYGGNCGYTSRSQRGVVDQSTNAPRYNRQWCETETAVTRNLPSDRPFQMRAASCCWIQTRFGDHSWRLLTSVDLGSRSDTGRPNRSPDIAILPFLRVPQNCPRTYKLAAFDPDGDQVRCRYGNLRNVECNTCHRHSGFDLDEGSCSLHYRYASTDPRVHGFEMVVEDFPQNHITLNYSDGSQASRAPLSVRRKRSIFVNPYVVNTPPPPTPHSWGWWHPRPAPTIVAPTTTPWWWWWHTTPPPPVTTVAPTTTPWWWWHHTTTTAPPTTASTTTAPPTTAPPTTTSTTTAPPTTTSTTTAPTTTPWWWWWHHTTTPAPPTPPWWWWHHTPPPPPPPPYTTQLHASTAALSKLPLQFSLLVDPPAPSCRDGEYLPQFVQPTPEDGEHIRAVVNKEVEIRVRARSTHATIHDIIISGPQNISKHRTTHGEFVIRWTPVDDDLGDYFPVCFAVEAVSGSVTVQPTTAQYYYHHYHPTPSSQSGIYQSEMRCVFLVVHNDDVKSHVVCQESAMVVSVEKSSFRGLREDQLRLSDSSNTACSLHRFSNSSHVIAVVPLNACGTQIEEDEENLVFKNEITTVDDPHDLITRKHLLEVQFKCTYAKYGNVTLGFTAHRRTVTVWERGFGTFTYQFEFYPDNQYRLMMDPDSYPLEYDVGTRIYMQIEATSSVNNTELFVESCRAAPYDNPNYSPTYAIIENGCSVDPTVEIYSTAHSRQFKFSMEAFKFIGLHDQVYISCSVLMCEAGASNTRCSQGCITHTEWGGHHHRKREALAQTARHFVSQGPLRLTRSAERSANTGLNLNLNLVFIAGCLLAAVGMISAVVVYKSKTSKVKYQLLPNYEN